MPMLPPFERITHVKLIDFPDILEVKGIDTFEDQTIYFLEAEQGLIEPYGERLVEQKFSSEEDSCKIGMIGILR